MDKLSALGIPFDSSKKKEELEVLLPADQVTQDAPAPVVVAVPDAESHDGIEVSDPLIMRPVDLPLVVKPTGGSWKNDAQAKFAATINAYAYRNPAKWEAKKDRLVAKLSELATNPGLLVRLEGGLDSNLTYKDKRFEQ